MARNTKSILGADGRVLGSRAESTRTRLLEATAKLLAEQGVVELKIRATGERQTLPLDAALKAIIG